MTPSTTTELDSAIAAHASWKHRLADLIRTGESTIDSSTVTKDDACVFGKWLKSYQPDATERPIYDKVRAKHAEFHSTVGAVVALAASGKRAEAERAIALGSAYTSISASLTLEMLNWKKLCK